jgi:uncharacterized membrane protein YdbT with pleckstrin-like domain
MNTQSEDKSTLTPEAIGKIESFLTLITKLSSGIGLPGLFLIITFYGIGKYGTPQQKIDMIDKYILFHEKNGFVIVVIFLVILSLIVYNHYGNGLKRCQAKGLEQKKEIEKYQAMLMPPSKRKK